MKERVTITLDSEILRKLDDKVDGYLIKNRSHAIELLISKSFGPDMPKVALIMAAGKIKKVKTASDIVPACMAPINGKPVLDHIISLFRKYNVKKIFLAICSHKDMIKDYFGDGSRFGVSIHYLEEDTPSGTSNLLKKIKSYVTTSFFVTNGDELKDFNLLDMYSYHKQHKSLGTIALTTVDDPSNYGVITMEGNRLTSFKEKPRLKEDNSKIINAGIYLFDPEIFKFIPQESFMLHDFLPKLAHDRKLFGYLFTGQWIDMTIPTAFELAKKSWKDIR